MLTRENLQRFISKRNSAQLGTDFYLDAKLCGISAEDLGEPFSCSDGSLIWCTEFGLLIQERDLMSLKELLSIPLLLTLQESA